MILFNQYICEAKGEVFKEATNAKTKLKSKFKYNKMTFDAEKDPDMEVYKNYIEGELVIGGKEDNYKKLNLIRPVKSKPDEEQIASFESELETMVETAIDHAKQVCKILGLPMDVHKKQAIVKSIMLDYKKYGYVTDHDFSNTITAGDIEQEGSDDMSRNGEVFVTYNCSLFYVNEFFCIQDFIAFHRDASFDAIDEEVDETEEVKNFKEATDFKAKLKSKFKFASLELNARMEEDIGYQTNDIIGSCLITGTKEDFKKIKHMRLVKSKPEAEAIRTFESEIEGMVEIAIDHAKQVCKMLKLPMNIEKKQNIVKYMTMDFKRYGYVIHADYNEITDGTIEQEGSDDMFRNGELISSYSCALMYVNNIFYIYDFVSFSKKIDFEDDDKEMINESASDLIVMGIGSYAYGKDFNTKWVKEANKKGITVCKSIYGSFLIGDDKKEMEMFATRLFSDVFDEEKVKKILSGKMKYDTSGELSINGLLNVGRCHLDVLESLHQDEIDDAIARLEDVYEKPLDYFKKHKKNIFLKK